MSLLLVGLVLKQLVQNKIETNRRLLSLAGAANANVRFQQCTAGTSVLKLT